MPVPDRLLPRRVPRDFGDGEIDLRQPLARLGDHSKNSLITYEAQVKGLLQAVVPRHPHESGEKAGIQEFGLKWIPAFAGMTGFRGACPGVFVGRGSQAELCA